MARFYGKLTGAGREQTAQGHASTGVSALVQGAKIGCRVVIQEENGKDVIYVFRTHGASNNPETELVATIS